MTTRNPYSGDAIRADIWDQGYLAGFSEPGLDHFSGPYSEDLSDVYYLGENAGRDDRASTPDDVDILEWFGELPEHAVIHAAGDAIGHVFHIAGGLIALVATVVTIPGDVKLHPVDDWTTPEDDGEAFFLAMCPRSDHSEGDPGVTSDNYWIGNVRLAFTEAAVDRNDHGHGETMVVRCSTEGGCGPVWPIAGN